MLHCQSDSRLWIQQACAFTHVLLAALEYLQARPSTSMSNWISEMADAVDAREAAQAPPNSETPVLAVLVDDAPTEPAVSPRMREVPVNDGRWTTEEYAELMFYIAQELHERDQIKFQELLDRQHADARPNPLADMERERRRAEAAEYQARYSTLIQSLQGLVHCPCNLHHLQPHDQLMLPVQDFHWQQHR